MADNDDVTKERFEYWCDGEMIRSFTTKESALRLFRLNSKKWPNKLHSIFHVVPKRTCIITHLP